MNSGKIRVLYVVENDRYGGGERAFAQLIKGLDKGRFDAYAACLDGTPGAGAFVREISRHARVLPLDLRRMVNFSAVPRLRQLFTEYGIEIVHSQGPRADFYCRLALDGWSLRHVCTVASPVEEYDVGPLKKAAYTVADRFLGSNVDAFVAVAAHIRRKLLAKGLPEGKVSVIYNGVWPEDYVCPQEWREKARADRGIRPEEFLVAAFCRLSPEKGLFTLLEAADLTGGHGIKYVIAGAGPLEGELKARVAAHRFGNDFRLDGFLYDVRALLAASDAVALPSLREGFPMSVLEAMAAGKPVVASRIEGVDESVTDGLNGLLVPPGDDEALAAAIRRLAADRRAAAAMGARGRQELLGRFTVDRMVKDHEALYTRLAG